jgi:two-component system sensor histidine kinase ChvG
MPRWPARASLTTRILALNIFALALLAGGFFYLDSYRARLVDQRMIRAGTEAELISQAVARVPGLGRANLILAMASTTHQRIRLYDQSGKRIYDSWQLAPPNYQLVDPDAEPWRRHVARAMDRIIDKVAGARHPPAFAEPETDRLQAWQEAKLAQQTGRAAVMVRNAPDRTAIISAAAPVKGEAPGILLTTVNARDITTTVRAERYRLGVVLAMVVGSSILLSIFLGRTIVIPLRKLARAAHQVRRGRAREIEVPRLPSRKDEIGRLARAVSDMSLALRRRIDATEAFAADVAHELKNPLASLGSAVDSLAVTNDDTQRDQLLALIRADIVRLDRLISEISDASRVDAELSRARFEPIDVGALVESLVGAWEERGQTAGVRIAFARPRIHTAMVMGEDMRLARAIDNLIDNAISFSPAGGIIEVGVARLNDEVHIRVEDQGPGVPEQAREEIFERFHSYRPNGESFGRHSGLGLAIAKAIVEGHDGSLAALDRADGQRGARFLIRLPAQPDNGASG